MLASWNLKLLFQFTEEKLGKSERTELDAHFENLLARADKTEEHTKNLLSCMEAYLQPNPSWLLMGHKIVNATSDVILAEVCKYVSLSRHSIEMNITGVLYV